MKQTHVPTLTDHILKEQRENKHAPGNFSMLLNQLENAGKIIASHVKASGLVDILGKTGKTNTFGEEIQKLDDYANSVLITTLITSGTVHAVISEEEKDPIFAPKDHAGEYIVYFDPLDGSSNIDTNCPIGTIFSVYHKKGGILQQGRKQVAAGYILYGSSVMFVYTVGHGVNGFTLDPATGSFLLSHPHITIPSVGDIYSINEGYEYMFAQPIQHYLQTLKNEGKSRGRFVGSLVADAHRTFIKGGIFLYPVYKNHPEGRLRLMIEVNPFALLTEQAGGKTLGSGKESPLETIPKHIHDRSPFIMGSPDNVHAFLRFLP